MNYTKKKNKLKFIIPFIIVLLVVSVFVVVKIRAGGKGYRTISVIEVSGTVSVVKDGIEYSAYVGMHLQEGHELVTTGNSYVRLVLDGDKYVKLEPGSRLVFEKLGFLGSGKTSIKLERGALTSEIVNPLREDEEFVVNTPNAVLAVRGTFFRVDLSSTYKGEMVAEVITYGGAVASKRIQPEGDVIEEEVLVEAGFKTSINMDSDKTVYVVEGVKIEDVKEDTVVSEPFNIKDISDDDIVDIYFAAKNGHELFVTEEEALTDIKEREIVIEECTPVYEKAEAVMEAKDIKSDKIAKAEIYANDAKPIEMVPENSSDGDSSINNTPNGMPGIPVIDGLGPEEPKPVPHEHVYVEELSKEPTCVEAGEKTFTCKCGDVYTEEIEATGHVEIVGAKETAHSICEVCNEVLEDGSMHVYADIVIRKATCIEDGEIKHSCECGYTYTEAIPAMGHSELPGATTECHSLCGICGEIMSSEHIYASEVTKEPTCTEKGETTYICECGGTYTEPIPEKGHAKTVGGTADCHTNCNICGEILENGTAHKYTSAVTKESTCMVDGIRTYTCDCGYGYTEAIPAKGHTEVNGNTAECHTMCEVCKEVLQDGSYHSMTDKVTLKPTCTVPGKREYTCNCGYMYIHEITENGHNEIYGGTADCHIKCDVCKEVISVEHNVSESIITAAGCKTPGEKHVSCDCGYDYNAVIDAIGHIPCNDNDVTNCDGCGTQLIILNSTNFPDTVLLETLKSEAYDFYDDDVLDGNELGVITEFYVPEGVTDTTGIELLTSMTIINLSNNTTVKDLTISGYVNGRLEITGNANLRSIEMTDSVNLRVADLTGVASVQSISAVNTTGLIRIDMGDFADSLTSLTINGSAVSELDVSAMTSLTTIDVTNNVSLTTLNVNGLGITELDLTGLEKLQTLNAKQTDITNLDLTYVADSLKILDMSDSGLESMTWPRDGSKPALTNINVSGTAITSLLFNGIFDRLESITCGGDRIESFAFIARDSSSLSSVTVTGSSSLKNFSITDNNYFVSVGSIDLSACDALESVVINGCTSLTRLSLPIGTGIKTLDLTNCTSMDTLGTGNTSALESLGITNTAISTIDVSAFPVLKSLNASSTMDGMGLSGDIVISRHSALETIDLSGTQVNSLTISNVGTLTSLKISDSERINMVDISGCTNLANCELKNNTILNAVRLVGAPISDVNGMLEGTTSVNELNVSGNTAVVTIDFNTLPNVSVINVSGCTGLLGIEVNSAINLVELNMSGTNFTGINLVNNMGLQHLDVSGSAITSLDISANQSLMTLNVSNTAITSIDATDHLSLTSINASGCASLVTLDANKEDEWCSPLSTLDITGCTSLTTLDLSFCENLASVDFSTCTNLTWLSVKNTAMTTLDLSNSDKLETLFVYDLMGLTELDLSNCTSLADLGASNTGLTRLDITGTSMLSIAIVACNSMTEFVATDVTTLERLYADKNPVLSSLDLTGCTGLTYVNFVDTPSATNYVTITATGTPNITTSIFDNGDTNYYTIIN